MLHFSIKHSLHFIVKSVLCLPRISVLKKNGRFSYTDRLLFVEEKQYEAYLTDKYPDKKVAILTCMDTRLVELLPRALNLCNGDAKIIKK